MSVPTEPRYFPVGTTPTAPGWYWERLPSEGAVIAFLTEEALSWIVKHGTGKYEYYGPLPDLDWDALRRPVLVSKEQAQAMCLLGQGDGEECTCECNCAFCVAGSTVPALAESYLEALALLAEVAAMPVHIGGDFGTRVRAFLGNV